MNANLCRIAPVSSALFTWDAPTRSLVAEASDLPYRGAFQRIYRDACDVGIAIRSRKTGAVVTFAVKHVEIDSNMDRLWWDLEPIGRNAPDCTVRIFND